MATLNQQRDKTGVTEDLSFRELARQQLTIFGAPPNYHNKTDGAEVLERDCFFTRNTL